MRRYVEFIVRHRIAVILGSLAATAFLALRIPSLEVYVDHDANLPKDHPFVQADREIRSRFGGRKVCVFLIVPKQGTIWNRKVLATVKAVTDEVLGIEGVLDANVLSLAARKVKDIRGTEEGIEVAPLMERVPRTEAEIEELRRALFRNPMYVNSIVAQSGRAAAVYLDFQERVPDDQVYSRLEEVALRHRSEDTAVYLTGMPIYIHYFSKYAREMAGHFAVALVVIAFVLYLAFGTLQGMFLPLLTALGSVAWGLGLMALAGVHMDGWNSMTPILIMAVAAGHSIQILKRYEEFARDHDSETAVVLATAKIGTVMLTAGGIAAAGFLSLLIFEIDTIRAFGLFTALGIMSALVLEMTFIPACRSLIPPPRGRRKLSQKWLDRVLDATALALLWPRARWMALGAGAAIVGASLVGARLIVADNAMRLYLPEDNEARVSSEAMERYLGGLVPLNVLYRAKEPGGIKDPRVLGSMADLQSFLLSTGLVNKTQSVADLVMRMNEAMHGDDPSYHKIPENRRLIAQYLLLYSISGDPDDFERYVDPNYNEALIWAYLRHDDAKTVERVIAKCQSYLKEHDIGELATVAIGGGGPVGAAVNAEMINGKILNIAQISGVIYLVSSFVLRSPAAGLFVLLPLVVAVMVNFAGLGFLHIWLNMGTATVAAMAVGIGADYAIYLIYRLREEYRRRGDVEEALRVTFTTSGKAILFVATAISAGYATLATSNLLVHRLLAQCVPLTMMVSAVGSLVLIPAALLIFEPRFVFSRKERRRASMTEGTEEAERLEAILTLGSRIEEDGDAFAAHSRGRAGGRR